MKKKEYKAPKIITNCIFLDGAISNCSACLIPEGETNDILIQEYDSNTETEDLYFLANNYEN